MYKYMHIVCSPIWASVTKSSKANLDQQQLSQCTRMQLHFVHCDIFERGIIYITCFLYNGCSIWILTWIGLVFFDKMCINTCILIAFNMSVQWPTLTLGTYLWPLSYKVNIYSSIMTLFLTVIRKSFLFKCIPIIYLNAMGNNFDLVIK